MAKKRNSSGLGKAGGSKQKDSMPVGTAAPVEPAIPVSGIPKKKRGSATDETPFANAATRTDVVPLAKKGGTGSDQTPL